MKHLLLILFLISLSFHASFAQKKWFVSPVLGLNLTPVKEGVDDPSYLKSGLSIGMLTGPVINDHWRLNFGLTFNQRHSSYSLEESTQNLGIIGDLIGSLIGGFDLTGTDFTDVQTQYWTVDIPVIMDYRFKSGFFLHGGMYFNSVISVANQIETTTHIPILEVVDLSNLGGFVESLLPKNETVNSSNSSSEGLRSTNVGLSGGFGADAGNIQLKFQYQYGFGSIRTDNFQPIVKNQQAISFHIAYLFFPTAGTGTSSKLKPRYNLELIK